MEAGGSCTVLPTTARQDGEPGEPLVQKQRTEGWSGDKRGLTHVQRRKSGSSTWSHRPSPSWQHSSARGLMGSPTARASTPSVSVGAKTGLALRCGAGLRNAGPRPGDQRWRSEVIQKSHLLLDKMGMPLHRAGTPGLLWGDVCKQQVSTALSWHREPCLGAPSSPRLWIRRGCRSSWLVTRKSRRCSMTVGK